MSGKRSLGFHRYVADVTKAYVYRKGVWGNKAGDRWELLPTVTREDEAASDHAAVVAEIAI